MDVAQEGDSHWIIGMQSQGMKTSLKMMFKKPNAEYKQNPTLVDALDKLLILHADHEQNCSTSTVHVL
jgi:citrate synthase